jgi:hypothetical protein
MIKDSYSVMSHDSRVYKTGNEDARHNGLKNYAPTEILVFT